METVAKFEGVSAYVLDKLVSMGYFQTRTEALRAGILELGKEYHILRAASELEDELVARKMLKIQSDIKTGKDRVVRFDKVLRKAGIKPTDLK